MDRLVLAIFELYHTMSCNYSFYQILENTKLIPKHWSELEPASEPLTKPEELLLLLSDPELLCAEGERMLGDIRG